MSDIEVVSPTEQLSVGNQLVVYAEGKDLYYPLTNLDLTFENSDAEILQRANGLLQEEQGFTLPDTYIVQRYAETGNIALVPKTPLGRW